jgi:hypothetical protein
LRWDEHPTFSLETCPIDLRSAVLRDATLRWRTVDVQCEIYEVLILAGTADVECMIFGMPATLEANDARHVDTAYLLRGKQSINLSAFVLTCKSLWLT